MRYALLLFALALAPPANASTLYVDSNVVGGANTGTSWTDAFSDLQPALAAADSLDEVWIAAGTYHPTSGTDRFLTFEIPGGVTLYGGFAGGETNLEDRDWQSNLSVLSGNIGNAGNSGDNSYHVVTTGPRTTLDGLTIQDGHGDGPTTDLKRGAGIYNLSDHVVLRFCRVLQNEVHFGSGGGFYTMGDSVLVEDCEFRFNHAYGLSNFHGYGSGAQARYGDLALTVFRRVLFRDNSGDEGGAGLWGGTLAEECNFLNNQTATSGGGSQAVYSVINCYYEGNSAVGSGGGAYNAVRIEDSEFTGNSARSGGGFAGGNEIHRCLIYGNSAEKMAGVALSSGNISNSVIFDNHATDVGGGLGGSGASAFNVTIVNNSAAVGGALVEDIDVGNSIIWGNQAPVDPVHYGIEIFGEANIAFSLVQGTGGSGPGWPLVYAHDAGGNIDADPLFADVAMGDLHIGTNSPAFDTGADSLVVGNTDLDGNLRIQGLRVDMGAYEADYVVAAPGPRPSPFLKGYPNPFNPNVTIEFELPSRVMAEVTVYDAAGRRVRGLWNGPASDNTQLTWDGKDDAGKKVGTGLYFVRLRTPGSEETMKIVLLK